MVNTNLCCGRLISSEKCNFVQTIFFIMEQLILNITNKSKLTFMKELLGQLSFVEIVQPKKIKATTKEKKAVTDLDDAIAQVKLHRQGKIKLKSLEEALNEL